MDVIFADGIHQIDTPLELRPEDSCTSDFSITWKAADGASPILSDGRAITGTWIEGVREELDEPGEWFLYVENQRLHYMPEPGGDPITLEFTAPFLNRIINVRGDVNAGTHVAHVHFEGLHSRHNRIGIGFDDIDDQGVRGLDVDYLGE